MKILVDAYKKQITHETPLTTWEWFIGQNWIVIFDLKDDTNRYLEIEKNNQEIKNNKKSPFYELILLAGLAFLTYSAKLFFNLQKPSRAVQ